MTEAFVPLVRFPGAGDLIQAVRQPQVGIPLAVSAVAFVMLLTSLANRSNSSADASGNETAHQDVATGMPS